MRNWLYRQHQQASFLCVKMREHKGRRGFTLAELLIALSVLGVITTFTIPKVLNSSLDKERTAICKEVAATFSTAYQAYKENNVPSSTTTFADLLPYINYVRVDTTSTIDDDNIPATSTTFSATRICYLLHNGAIISPANIATYPSFNGTGSLNAIFLVVDPDGKYGGDRAVTLWLYFNGRVTSNANVLPGTTNSYLWSGGGWPDPDWFKWD
jgi:prepilin-type N-terminal cleavage/methylation domain-containing protein